VNKKSSQSFHEVRIIGTGSYVPERILTNAALEKIVETSDEWITTRTGIKERHIAADDEAVSHMSTKAAERALDAAGIKASDLDMIILGSFTGDLLLPSCACLIQNRLGISNIPAFDVAAACSAFVYSLAIAKQFIATGTYKNILVIGSDKLTAFTDWTDRNTCILFGDGAGAAIVSSKGDGPAIGTFELGAKGELAHLVHIPMGGSLIPLTEKNIGEHGQYMKMEGRELFKFAVQKMEEAVRKTLQQEKLTLDDVKYIVPHQANVRILQAVAKNLGVDNERIFSNLEKYGNTSAASTPICLDELIRTKRFVPGDKIVLVAFGGGFTYGSCILEW
jgi:3-oxoacyl-[acyl-carrier-protein] synthase III